jgi:predicted dehydrogenase
VTGRPTDKLRVGVIGCGDVAFRNYLPAIRQIPDRFDLVAVCDQDKARAERAREEFGAGRCFFDSAELFASKDVEAVIILTSIKSHALLAIAALEAGKHVYVEKVLAVDMADADRVVNLVEQSGLVLACAPSTILVSAHSHVKQLIASGDIGQVTAVHAIAAHGGPARWDVYSSDPTWFYQRGAGPILDLAPYPVHVITQILGPAKRVTAFSGLAVPEVMVTTNKMSGHTIQAQVDDTTPMIVDFGNATFATIDVSYNMLSFRLPAMQFWGTLGALTAPRFSGDEVGMWHLGDKEWTVLHLPATPQDRLGVAAGLPHWADCVRQGRQPIMSARHGRHVLEVLLSAQLSARTGKAIELSTVF